MKILNEKTYYAPTFIDQSRTSNGEKTGELSAFLMTRTFRKVQKKNRIIGYDAKRGLHVITWDKDTQDAKGRAFATAIKKMTELPWLDENRSLFEIPEQVKSALSSNI